jgi:hypothetical protein
VMVLKSFGTGEINNLQTSEIDPVDVRAHIGLSTLYQKKGGGSAGGGGTEQGAGAGVEGAVEEGEWVGNDEERGVHPKSETGE